MLNTARKLLLLVFFGLFCAGPVFSAELPQLDQPGPYKIGYDSVVFFKAPYGFYPATIRYPAVKDGWHAKQYIADRPYPVVISVSGLLGPRIAHKWIAEHLTSHGYITMTFTPPFPPSPDTTQWACGFIEGIEKITSENENGRSPIHAMADTSRIGITGLSMGGGGTIEAAAQCDKVKAAVALAPLAYDKGIRGRMSKDVIAAAPKVKAPIMLQVGANDGMIMPEEVYSYYKNVPDTVDKCFIEIYGGNHIGYVDNFYAHFAIPFDNLSSVGFLEQERVSKLYALAWFDYYLRDKKEYKDIFTTRAATDKALNKTENNF